MTDQQLDQLFKDGLVQEQAFDGAEKQWIFVKQQMKPPYNYSATISILLLLFGCLFLMFYFIQPTKHLSESSNTIVQQEEKPSKHYNIAAYSEDNSSKEEESTDKLKKNNRSFKKDNHSKTNILNSPKQGAAFSTLNEKNDVNQPPKIIESKVHTTKEKKSINKTEENFKPVLLQKLVPASNKITSMFKKSSSQKNQITHNKPTNQNKEATIFTTSFVKPVKVAIKDETHIKTTEKLNSIHTLLAASTPEKFDRTVAKIITPSIFTKKDQNKKWTILAGLSFSNLLNKTANTNVKDSSSVVRNFGLNYTMNNKFVLGLHYKFNTVAKRIKQIDEVYNLPELPSLSDSENIRENISIIYERNLFNLFFGYQAYQNKRLHFIPFVGLQSGYFPSHTIKYGVNEVYGEQNLKSLVPSKFYWANDVLFGADATVNLSSSISFNARYEYQLSLNNNYNWQTPHLISTFIAVKF